MTEQYILAFHPADQEAPTSVRTYGRDEALDRAAALNEIVTVGKWKVHQISEAITP